MSGKGDTSGRPGSQHRTARQSQPGCSAGDSATAGPSQPGGSARDPATAGPSQPGGSARDPATAGPSQPGGSAGDPTSASQSQPDTGTDPVPVTAPPQNPWPYISDFFEFKGKNGKNLQYQCLSCMPMIKMYSATLGTKANLYGHMERKHPDKVKPFDDANKSGSRRGKQKHRLGFAIFLES
jgi:hypothetical protein